MMEFLKFAAVMAVGVFAVWAAYRIGHSNGVAVGRAQEKEWMLGPESELQKLALRMHNSARPYSPRGRYSDLDRYDRDTFLAAAKVCQAECEG